MDPAFRSAHSGQALQLLLPNCTADNGTTLAFVTQLLSQLCLGRPCPPAASVAAAQQQGSGDDPLASIQLAEPLAVARLLSKQAADAPDAARHVAYSDVQAALQAVVALRAVSEMLAEKLQPATASKGARRLQAAAPSALEVECTTLRTLWRATPAAINEALLCGFGKGACASQGVQQYVAAIDWTRVQRDRLAYTLWFNTSNLPTNPRQNKEKPERVNAVRRRCTT